ncbi:hypothetical protein TRFO_13705 [Tritrichomonas foetus]|uniref:Initiator binding domain-containing protein n=1 Tax=Tritrichomonas foetus TaxID=1144522 RepID=A0A1J4KYB7_9EUKA|nr:hypothetical protein TRFO_13705 [Tritrichomonas foetus]|eukprot:OHT15872.1 hypothetical protein TRFO_13705 [Tritrichomonas foetus]
MDIKDYNSFNKLCNAVLGRPFLRGTWPWKSSSSALLQIFADFQQFNLPWWKIGKLAGAFFFYDHVFLNFELLSHSTKETADFLEKKLLKDNFIPIETPDYLKNIFLDNINLSTEDWKLFPIQNGVDSENLISLLHHMKCPPIRDFKPETDNPKSFEYSYSYFVQMEVETEPELFEKSVSYNSNPGIYYQNLIPPEKIPSAPKCWLFKNPTDDET